MKKTINKITIFTLLIFISFCYFNFTIINAKEPIMQERYIAEEQKIKRANFIWTTCIDSLIRDNIITNEEAKNIHKYLNDSMKCRKFDAPQKKYNLQKRALKINTVDELIKNNIINEDQSSNLRNRLNKYNISILIK